MHACGSSLSSAGRRLSEIRASVMRKVEPGEVAQSFMALAKERGMKLGSTWQHAAVGGELSQFGADFIAEGLARSGSMKWFGLLCLLAMAERVIWHMRR